MPRIAQVVTAGYPRRITQRGNYRQKIFADDTDRRKYLSLLKEESLVLSFGHISLLPHVKSSPLYRDSPKRRFNGECI